MTKRLSAFAPACRQGRENHGLCRGCPPNDFAIWRDLALKKEENVFKEKRTAGPRSEASFARGAPCLLVLIALSICHMSYGAESFPFLGQVNTDRIHIRAGQSQNFESLAVLKEGQELVIVGKSYSWYKVRLPADVSVYISADYVKMKFSEIGEVTGNRVNVRAGAGGQFNVVGQLKKGYLVRTKKKITDWYEIEPPENVYGWVSDEYIIFKSNEVPPPRVVEPPDRNIYSQKSLVKEVPDVSVDVAPDVIKDGQKQDETNAPEMTEAPVAKEIKTIETKPAETKPTKAKPAEMKKEVLTVQNKPSSSEENIVSVIGKVVPLEEKQPFPEINHKLMVDKDTAYYLQGQKGLLNGYLGFKIKVNGKIRKDLRGNLRYPVIQVTKIYLVL